MVSTTQLIVDLTLLLAGSVLAGELANHLGQAALVGQLIVGVILGPTLLGALIGLPSIPPELTSIQILATIFILFLAGLHVVPEQIFRMGPGNLLFGVGAFAVPFAACSIFAWLLFPGLGILTVLFIALTLSITALPVMGIMLTEFGLNDSKFGQLLLNTALINELVAVSVFAVLLQLASGSYSGPIAVSVAILSVAIFLGVILSIHMGLRALRAAHHLEALRRTFQQTWKSRSGGFGLLMVMVLGAALFSQYLGLTYVVGAFYAGLLVTEDTAGTETHRSISVVFDTITWGFFVPLFFVLVGIEMNLRLLLNPWDFVVLATLFGVALLSKLGIGFGSGRWLGWSKPESTAIGFLITSRGAVELAMAVILLQLKIFTTTLFTVVAAVGLLTTILSPIGALRAWESSPESREALYKRVPMLRPGATRSRAFKPYFPYGPLEYVDRAQSRGASPPLPSSHPTNPASAPSPPPIDTTPPPLPDPKRPRSPP
jgi:Kef-type K+ transport system membrane component KefB